MTPFALFSVFLLVSVIFSTKCITVSSEGTLFYFKAVENKAKAALEFLEAVQNTDDCSRVNDKEYISVRVIILNTYIIYFYDAIVFVFLD